MKNSLLALIQWLIAATILVSFPAFSRADIIINEIQAAASERLLQYDANSVPKLGTGTRWYEAAYNDTAWLSGIGPFGYGTVSAPPTPIATNLQTSVQYLTPTTYFRKTFAVSPGDAARADQVQLVVDYNDGFVAFLNGVEIARRNGGPAKKWIYHDQPAYNRESYSGTASIPTNTNAETINVGAASTALVSGNNILAIHLLNASVVDGTYYLRASLRISGTPVVNLVNFNDSWKYFPGVVEPAGNLFDPATLGSGKQFVPWGANTYDDSDWFSGIGPFGYGAVGAIGTNVQARLQNITPSLYQRVVFNVTAAQAADPAALRLLVGNDDGFVAYLNGVEVTRRRLGLPNTFTPRDAVADADQGSVQNEVIFLDAAARLLKTGSNILAIQTHNYAQNNGDFLMKADLQTNSGVPLVTNNTTWRYFAGTAEPVVVASDEEEESFPDGPDGNADWIELFNDGPSAVSLLGWRLSDDPGDTAKWVFPDVSIPAGGYLVVVADGADLTSNPGGYLHTNFSLDRDGEFLGLYNPTGTLVSQIAPTYPEQVTFFGYGRDASGALKYTDRPTPGEANSGTFFDGLVATPTVNIPGRFYPTTQSLTFASATPGAVMRYTTNGSEPTAASPQVPVPFNISTNTALRVRAFLNGSISSETITHTYLINQSAARRSLPAVCLTGDEQRAFYRPFGVFAIVNNNTNAAAGPLNYTGGIWSNHPNATTLVPPNTPEDPLLYNAPMQGGKPAERAIAFEVLHTDATPDLRIGSYLRCAGSPYSRQRYQLVAHNSATPNSASPWTRNPENKPQLNVFFRNDVGPSPLKYQLVPGSPIDRYDNVRLRAGKNDLSNPFIRDEFSRRSFVEMGQVTVLGDFCNVFVNSVFKGFFNICQRPREPYFREARDTDSSFDVRNITVIADGDTLAYNELVSYAKTRNMASPADYQGMLTRMDAVNFADYIIFNVHAAMADWPGNNYVMDRERSPAGRWRFSVWDGEGGYGGFGRNPAYRSFNDIVSGNVPGETVPTKLLYTVLKQSPEFRQLCADRIQKHFFNGGALTDPKLQARFNVMANRIQPIMSEVVGQTITPFLNIWISGQGDTTRLTTNVNMPTRRRALFEGYIDDTAGSVTVPGFFPSEGLWPTTLAPVFGQFGGSVPQNYPLSISNPNASGVIYYTTNGNDPRATGGGVQGIAYTSPITISQTTLVRARVQLAGSWSPLLEAVFTPPTPAPLIISEIMYNPLGSGVIVGSEFEFVEVKNVGLNSVALGGMELQDGITFTFPNGMSLAPGGFAVVARNPTQFAARYPGVPIVGAYGPGTTLNNAGETVTLADVAGAEIFSVAYSPLFPWPAAADGGGMSVVPLNPNGFVTPANGNEWRASSNVHGSPGADDPLLVPPVLITELLANPGAGQTDSVELFNAGTEPADISGWWLSDSASSPKKFVLPAGTVLVPGSYLVLTEAQFNPTPGVGTRFAFDRVGGEDVILSSANAAGTLTGYVHQFNGFGASPTGVSLGRYMDSTNAERFVLQSSLTLGAVNSGPLVGPVVITEVMYNYPGRSDYVELINTSAAAVPLFDPANPANTWKLSGLDFTFPENITLQPRQVMIVWGPSIGSPGPIHTQYSFPTSVAAYSSLADSLANNGGELIALQRPAEPVAGQPLSYIQVDAVRYNDVAPWPNGAGSPDGGGLSLERINWRGFGDDVVNWRASSANGGNPGLLPPATFSSWQSIYFTSAQSADPNYGGTYGDPDQDGLGNFWEFALGRNPLAADADGAISFSLVPDAAAGPFLTVQYRRNLAASGLSLHADTTGALGGWTLDGSIPVGLPVNNGDGTETLTRRDTISPAGAAERFIRLRGVSN